MISDYYPSISQAGQWSVNKTRMEQYSKQTTKSLVSRTVCSYYIFWSIRYTCIDFLNDENFKLRSLRITLGRLFQKTRCHQARVVAARKNFGGFNIIRGVCIESVSHSLGGLEPEKLPHKYAHALGHQATPCWNHNLNLGCQQFPDDWFVEFWELFQRLKPSDPVLSMKEKERETFSTRPDRDVDYSILVQHYDESGAVAQRTTGQQTQRFGLGLKTSCGKVSVHSIEVKMLTPRIKTVKNAFFIKK